MFALDGVVCEVCGDNDACKNSVRTLWLKNEPSVSPRSLITDTIPSIIVMKNLEIWEDVPKCGPDA